MQQYSLSQMQKLQMVSGKRISGEIYSNPECPVLWTVSLMFLFPFLVESILFLYRTQSHGKIKQFVPRRSATEQRRALQPGSVHMPSAGNFAIAILFAHQRGSATERTVLRHSKEPVS